MSYGCDDPYKHEREGRDAARYRQDYGYEHEERMREARWGSYDSCDAAYARGYEREQRYREEVRQEERQREEYEMRRAQERAEESRQIEEAMYYAQQEQYPEPPYDPGPPYPEHENEPGQSQ